MTIFVVMLIMVMPLINVIIVALIDDCNDNNDSLLYYFLNKEYNSSNMLTPLAFILLYMLFLLFLMLSYTPFFVILLFVKVPKPPVEKPLEEKEIDQVKSTYRQIVYVERLKWQS